MDSDGPGLTPNKNSVVAHLVDSPKSDDCCQPCCQTQKLAGTEKSEIQAKLLILFAPRAGLEPATRGVRYSHSQLRSTLRLLGLSQRRSLTPHLPLLPVCS